MSKTPLFSVFTPTFNRIYSLPRVYQSLKAQTLKDFEWVIIDDGSADGTTELVKQWQAEAEFPIIYHWQPNQGKHVAYNTAADMVSGELFAGIDSDDEIIPDALEILAKRWSRVTTEQKEYISGMMYVSKDQHGNIVGDRFPEDGEICDLAELLFVRKVKGDKGGFLQAKVFKMYPFPESVKNVYVPEGVFIQQMSRDWKMVCINEVLRIYWIDERADHLGQKMKTTKNYPGDRLNNLAALNYSLRLFRKTPRFFLANAAYFSRLSFYLKIGIRQQWKEIKTIGGKLLWLSMLPVGFIMFLKERKSR